MTKIYDGLLDAFYKKWELYLYRLFQLGKYIENALRYCRITGPDINELLDIDGCDHSIIRIPANPFFLRENDEEMFLLVYDPLECRSENDKDLRVLFREIINRINEIKRFIGITRNTRYIGEPNAEKRLCNEIDIYMKHPKSLSSIHNVVLGNPDESYESLKTFQKFLKDRRSIKRRRTFQQY